MLTCGTNTDGIVGLLNGAKHTCASQLTATGAIQPLTTAGIYIPVTTIGCAGCPGVVPTSCGPLIAPYPF